MSDLKWLAGWLEGEGSFGFYDGRARVCANSTDRDVVERAATILGTKPWQRPAAKLGWKPQWRTELHGVKAIALMVELFGELGERRRAKVQEILNEWEHQRFKPLSTARSAVRSRRHRSRARTAAA